MRSLLRDCRSLTVAICPLRLYTASLLSPARNATNRAELVELSTIHLSIESPLMQAAQIPCFLTYSHDPDYPWSWTRRRESHSSDGILSAVKSLRLLGVGIVGTGGTLCVVALAALPYQQCETCIEHPLGLIIASSTTTVWAAHQQYAIVLTVLAAVAVASAALSLRFSAPGYRAATLACSFVLLGEIFPVLGTETSFFFRAHYSAFWVMTAAAGAMCIGALFTLYGTNTASRH